MHSTPLLESENLEMEWNGVVFLDGVGVGVETTKLTFAHPYTYDTYHT